MNIAVLMGGTSSERNVSLRSGGAVASALQSLGHTVAPIDLTADSIEGILKPDIEVYFIAMHGKFGEDGTLQRLLEERDIAFTGSDSAACARAMDKIASKKALIAKGVPTPRHTIISRSDDLKAALGKLGKFGYPLVLKPRAEGSSVGVSIHHGEATVAEGIQTAYRYGDELLVEQFIAGRELTVGILEERPLPVIEMIPRRSFFDYEAKYEDQETQYIVKPSLPQSVEEQARETALAAHKALGCRCFSRIDIMMSPSNELFVLEVNAIPGMSERSLLPKAARASGIPFPALCMQIIADALRR